jgi:hypothetical protein
LAFLPTCLSLFPPVSLPHLSLSLPIHLSICLSVYPHLSIKNTPVFQFRQKQWWFLNPERGVGGSLTDVIWNVINSPNLNTLSLFKWYLIHCQIG